MLPPRSFASLIDDDLARRFAPPPPLTADSTDVGRMDSGRSMVETNEVAMTRASVATDFIMVDEVEVDAVVEEERRMMGRNE